MISEGSINAAEQSLTELNQPENYLWVSLLETLSDEEHAMLGSDLLQEGSNLNNETMQRIPVDLFLLSYMRVLEKSALANAETFENGNSNELRTFILDDNGSYQERYRRIIDVIRINHPRSYELNRPGSPFEKLTNTDSEGLVRLFLACGHLRLMGFNSKHINTIITYFINSHERTNLTISYRDYKRIRNIKVYMDGVFVRQINGAENNQKDPRNDNAEDRT